MTNSTTSVFDHAWSATKRSGAVLPDGDRLLLARMHAAADHLDVRLRLGREQGLDGPEPAFIYPAVETLAEWISCSVRTAYDRLARLEEAGWIRRRRRRVEGRSMLGWELAEGERYCGRPQVNMRDTTDEPAGCRSANPQVNLRRPACRTAGARRSTCERPHHTLNNTIISQGEVVDFDQARRAREILSLEAEIVRVVAESGVAGTSPGPTFVEPMVERIEAGDATVEDVKAVLAEYKRRKNAGDKGLPTSVRVLFYAGAAWTRTQMGYLRRRPVGPAKRGASSSLDGAEARWSQVRAEAADSAPPDDGAGDEALLAAFFGEGGK